MAEGQDGAPRRGIWPFVAVGLGGVLAGLVLARIVTPSDAAEAALDSSAWAFGTMVFTGIGVVLLWRTLQMTAAATAHTARAAEAANGWPRNLVAMT